MTVGVKHPGARSFQFGRKKTGNQAPRDFMGFSRDMEHESLNVMQDHARRKLVAFKKRASFLTPVVF